MKDSLLKSITEKGTFSDKCASFVLLIQENPLKNIKNIDKLLELTNRRREDALIVCKHLLIIFTEIFFDMDGIKKSLFKKDPEKIEKIEKKIQKRMFSFLLKLESLSIDTIEHVRKKTIELLKEFLSKTSVDQENIVSLLVRRFSDQIPGIASRASYVSAKITEKRPELLPIFVQEIQKKILRLEKRGIIYVLDFMANVKKNDMVSELALFFLSEGVGLNDQHQDKLNLRFLKVLSMHNASIELLSEYEKLLFRFVFGNVVGVAIEALKSIRRLSRRDKEVKIKMQRALVLLMVNKKTWISKQKKTFLVLLNKELSKMEKEVSSEMEKNIFRSCFLANSEYSFGSLQILFSFNKKRADCPELKGLTRHYNPFISNIAKKIQSGEKGESFSASSLSEYSSISILEKITLELRKKCFK